MVQHYYRNVHAVVFVYDMTKIASFDNMPAWIEECDKHNLNKVVGFECFINSILIYCAKITIFLHMYMM